MQARGENLFSIIKAFTKSSKLQITHERESNISTANQYEEGHAVFFDYLTLFMVCYKAHDLCLSWHCWFDIYILLADVWYCLSSLSLSWWILQIYYTRKVAMLLHSIPIAIFLAASVFSKKQTPGLLSWFSTFCDFAKGKSSASYVNTFMQPCCCDRGPSFCTPKVLVLYSWGRVNYFTLTLLIKKKWYLSRISNIVIRFVNFSGLIFHATGIFLAIVFPIIFSILRLLFTSHAMHWWVHFVELYSYKL